MTTPQTPEVTGSKPLRKRVLLQDRDLVMHIVGILDLSLFPISPRVQLSVHGRIMEATLVKTTTRAIWYREITAAQEPTQ